MIDIRSVFEARYQDKHQSPALKRICSPVVASTYAGIPEPGTYALMGLGLVGITLVRRQRR